MVVDCRAQKTSRSSLFSGFRRGRLLPTTVLNGHSHQPSNNAITFAAIFALITLPTFGQTLGPEIPMSPPLAAPADHGQRFPSVATDGEVFLVAWTNALRNGAEVFAARVSASVQLLDEISFPIATRPENPIGAPRVAWTGRVFLVMVGSVGKRISRDGKVLGEVRLPPGQLMSLTCSTSRCLVVMQDSPGRLLGTILDGDGQVVTADFEIARFAGQAGSVTAASNGANFLVAWFAFNSNSSTEREALYSRPVSNSGSLGQSIRIAVSDFALGYHDVESDGSGYMLVWMAGENSSRVQARRFNSSGNPSADAFILHSATRLGHEPSLARWDRGYLLLLWTPERRMLEAFRLRSDGSKAESAPVGSWVSDSSFAVGASSRQAFVVWETPASARADSDIHGSFIDLTSGTVSPTLLISQSARSQYTPALTRAGSSVFAVWQEHLPGKDTEISGNLADEVSAGSSFQLSDRFDPVRGPAVASNGGDKVLVAWTEEEPSTRVGRAVAQAFEASGKKAISPPVVVAEQIVNEIKVAAGKDGFLVTWQELRDGQLHGALLNSDASIIRRFPISAATALIRPGGVIWGQDRYLVTWSEARPSPEQGGQIASYDYAIAAALTSGEGVVLKTMQISNAGGSTPSQVAWDGTRFLVTWERNLTIEAARVSIDGIAEVPRRFSTSGGGPAVVWDGTAFIGVGNRTENGGGERKLMMTKVTHAQLDSREGGGESNGIV